MVDIILFFPKHWLREFRPPTQPPFGLMMISDAVLKKGYKVKIFDERLPDNDLSQLVPYIKKAKIFGVSAQSGPQINNGLNACKFAKKINPDIKIVWGGVHATLLPEQTLEHPLIDFLIVGEGEETFSEFIDLFFKDKSLKKVKSLAYKEKGKVIINEKRPLITDLDKVDIRWDLVNHKDYIHDFEGRRSLSTITSRGCYFRCSFCYNQTFFGKRWFRGWSAKKVMNEVQRFEEWKVETIKFEDDNMLVEKKRTKEICSELAKNKYDFLFSAPIRAHYFKDDFIAPLKKVGYKYCNIGAESGSQRILDLMHKDTKPAHFIQAAKVGRKYDIDLSYHWILGYPTETFLEALKTVELIKKIEAANPKAYNILNIFAPYPGTESYQLAIKEGFKPPKSLESWTQNFREECKNLGYLKNREVLEKIRLSGIIKTMAKRTHWYKPMYRPLIKSMGFVQDVRWKYNNFKAPVELELVNMFKKKFME